jgi:hypothetical protein
MVALSNRHVSRPVSYEEVTVAALHIGAESPLKSQWEPSLGVKILDRLNRVSVSIAQVVTFVTYVLVLIVIVALLIGGIYSTWKNLSRRSD